MSSEKNEPGGVTLLLGEDVTGIIADEFNSRENNSEEKNEAAIAMDDESDCRSRENTRVNTRKRLREETLDEDYDVDDGMNDTDDNGLGENPASKSAHASDEEAYDPANGSALGGGDDVDNPDNNVTVDSSNVTLDSNDVTFNSSNVTEDSSNQRIHFFPSSSSSSSSNSSFSEDSHNFLAEVDVHSDSSDEDIPSFFRGFARGLGARAKDEAAVPVKVLEEAPYYHGKIFQKLLKREIGFPGPKINGPLVFQNSVVSDPDVVKRLGLYHKYEKHSGCVNSLHFNETGNLLASGSDDMNVVIYDWIKQKVAVSFLSHHKSNIFQTKFMPHSGDSHVVTTARDGQVRVALLSATGSCRSHKKLAFHKGAAHKLALINDSAHEFYSCGEDGVTFTIDLRQEKPSMSFTTKHKNKKVALYSVHANPMKSYEICVVGRDPYVRIYDVRNVDKENPEDTSLKKFCPEHLRSGHDHITAAVYNYNGSEILASYNDDDIFLFDSSHPDGSTHIKQYHGHRNSATVKGVNFYGAKSEYVVSGSDCSNVFMWSKDNSEIVNVFHADEAGVVNVIETHPTLPLMATSGLDSDIKFWTPHMSPASGMKSLQALLKKNNRQKRKSRYENDFDDSRLLWFLMRTLRRRAQEEDHSSDGSSDNPAMNDDIDEEEHDDDDDDDDDEDEMPGARRSNIQCASS